MLKLSTIKPASALAVVLMCIAASFALASCSGDEPAFPKEENAVPPEDDDKLYLGAWISDGYEDGDVQIIVLDPDYKATYYFTDEEYYSKGMYGEKYIGSYRVSGKKVFITIDGETLEGIMEGHADGAHLIIKADGMNFNCYRINRKYLPTIPIDGDDDDEPAGRDALSNTSWTITSMTGWGAGAISDYKNVQLRFGANGSVTQWHSSSDSYNGTYTLSGNTMTISGLPMVYEWGPKYAYSLSGNKLTLISEKGSKLETSFILSRN